MKNIILTLILLITATYCFSQRVGIGTVTPAARLHVIDSNVVFTGPLNVPDTTNINPPSPGPGSRMMWYPQKAAFRVGAVTGTQWDKTSIGRNSFAAGYNPWGQGFASVAMGAYTHAFGDSSVALGAHSYAFGNTSSAIGHYSKAEGNYSHAIGAFSRAGGDFSTALGTYAIAEAQYATSIGSYTSAISPYTVALGHQTFASGWYSTVMGLGSIASGETAISMGNHTVATGHHSLSTGDYTLASGYSSTAMGSATIAGGYYSMAIGHRNIAKSHYSLVIGHNNDTTAIGSLFEIGNGNLINRTNALTALDNGNIGIGTANPHRKLEIFIASSGGSIYHPETSVGIESNGSHYIDLITSDIGETGILFGNKTYWGADGGITYRSVSNTLDPRCLYFRVAGNRRMVIYPNGNMWLEGIYIQASDARLKKDIIALSNTMASLQQLNGYTYHWKEQDRDQDQQIGLLAQEVQKVYPQLVKQTSEGYLSINYNGMIPVLLEALKEQCEILKEQQKQIDELKQRLH
jgi:hypothetical protein